jgi:hypothetical protein
VGTGEEELHASAAGDGQVGLLCLGELGLGELEGLLELLDFDEELGDRADVDDRELGVSGSQQSGAGEDQGQDCDRGGLARFVRRPCLTGFPPPIGSRARFSRE